MHARTHTHTQTQKVQEEWYESLHDWDAAHKLYQSKQYLKPEDIHLTLGRMRCLHAMGEWWVAGRPIGPTFTAFGR